MKAMKKILALVIGMIMVMGITAMADPATTQLKVTPVDGHAYTAYQLFTGDLAADGVTLSNVKWGTNAASTINYKTKDANGKYTVAASVTAKAGDPVPQDVLDYLASLGSTRKTGSDGVEQDTADIVNAMIAGDGFPITSTDTDVLTGYYVVRDAYTNADEDGRETTTLSTTVAQIVGPTNIQPKAGTTQHEKKVLDINDTTDTALNFNNLQGIASGWDVSADHDFGDQVPFKLTTTIGSDFAKYEKYYLAVSDNLFDGLVLNADTIKVFVDGKEATPGQKDDEDGSYYLTTDTTNKKSFKVEFAKLNANTNAGAGKKVDIYYTATLDAATAKIGNPGNWNESYAEFSNNPNGTQEGTGKTPTVTAVVFTYKTIVNKVDEDGTTPLKGAEFTLVKKLEDGTTANIAVLRFDKDGEPVATASTANTAADGTTFSFNGLDDGVYTLTETVTPNGYNTIDPVTFQVVAGHTKVERSGSVTSLEVKNEDGTAFTGNLEFTPTATLGSIETDVVNKKGATLPSTGGMGTTIFYIIGAILVIGAGILLVSKKRMSAN